jgi:hypothetical protein
VARSPFRYEPKWNRIARTVVDPRVMAIDEAGDRARFRELRAQWRRYGKRGHVILARIAIAAGHAEKAARKGVRLATVLARYRKEYAGLIPVDLLEKLEIDFAFGWSGGGETDRKVANAIRELQNTPNERGNNTARSKRRRAWRVLDKFK